MGGDHKCSVCQATFTRPQHVARHMRSHTGDRPYKCQYCGDQFARSDLLSRHINKCHGNEKPIPIPSGTRRKGSAPLFRATTSKQICDQCVQSALPCDNCNPCSKCMQRKLRCTYVKFHRQTLPSGPGHGLQGSSSSGGIQAYPEEAVLSPAPQFSFPSMHPENVQPSTYPAAHVYPSDGIPSLSFSPPNTVAQEYPTTKFHAGADIFRRNASLPDLGESLYPNHQATPLWPSWSPDSTYEELRLATTNSVEDQFPDAKGMQHIGGDLQAAMTRRIMEANELGQGSTASPQTDYSPSSHYCRPVHRHSLDLGGGDNSGSRSLSSSASSSSAHFPLSELQHHQDPYQEPDRMGQDQTALRTEVYSPNARPRPISEQSDDVGNPNQGDGSFSSALGLMSLDDPTIIAGLSTDGPPFFTNGAPSVDSCDPNITPMPSQYPSCVRQRSNATGNGHVQSVSKEAETKMLWKEYIRTPLSGPGSAIALGQRPNDLATPGNKRTRVSSLPSVKTPLAHDDVTTGDDQAGNATSSLRTTLHGNADDLRSYEAAVLARKPPATLSLTTRRIRGKPQVSGEAQQAAASSNRHASFTSNVASSQESASARSHSEHIRLDPAGSSVINMREGFSMRYATDHSGSSRESLVSTGGEGSSDTDMSRPCFKRLASQMLGSAHAKRVLFAHHISDRENDTGVTNALNAATQGGPVSHQSNKETVQEHMQAR